MAKLFHSLRFRLVASYLLVILLAMGVAAGLAWVALDRAFLDMLSQNLLAEAGRVARTAEAGGASGLVPVSFPISLGSAEEAPSPYSQVSNIVDGYHTRLIDEAGGVVLDLTETGALTVEETSLASSDEERARQVANALNLDILPWGADERGAGQDLLDRPEVQRALSGEPATAVRAYAWAPDRRVLYAAHPVRSPEGDVVGIVYIATPIPRFSLNMLPEAFAPQVLGGVGLAVLLAGLAGFLLARTLTRPLQRLTVAASALARGDPAPPIPPASTDELRQLGRAFNTMNVNLTAALDALAAQARQREAILHGLADAVVAVDAAGEILLANPAASTLLESAPLEEVTRRTLETGEPQTTEIIIQGRVFELLTTPLRDAEGGIGGAVAVGHDVTTYRQLDRLRTNFVSDVSHELRTPLTAIKGFVETLQDGAAEDPAVRDRFLQTIAVETERLTRLTEDLLLLTRADAGRLELHIEHIDLAACARRAAAQLEIQAREKGIAIAVEPPGEPALATADADRLHQVLVNLLDNAVKFAPAGGSISITFGRAGDQVTCTVADTGPGIPPEELPHLFERFYRGDPARAREGPGGGAHGAGLGLAIARAIIEAHSGCIWVESEPGAGARFHFTLPSPPDP